MSYQVLSKTNSSSLTAMDQKPDITSVLWFSIHEDELIPHVAEETRVERARKGVLNTNFRKIQSDMFKRYFNLTDCDIIPYQHPYVA